MPEREKYEPTQEDYDKANNRMTTKEKLGSQIRDSINGIAENIEKKIEWLNQNTEEFYGLVNDIEIARMQLIYETILSFIDSEEEMRSEYEREGKDPEEVTFGFVNMIDEWLTNRYEWQAKFTTGETKDRDKYDSIYFMTESGVSLRLKRAVIREGKGLREVLQPVHEKIMFVDGEKQSEKPIIGFGVKEHTTQKFTDMIASGKRVSNYKSPIKRRRTKDGNTLIYEFDQDVDDKVHKGHDVNHIF